MTSPGTTTELPRLIPDAGDLPDGLQLSSAYGDQEFWGESTTYGRLLAIEWTHSGRGSGIEPSPDLGPTTVRGHQGHTCAGGVCAQLGLKGVEAGLEWTERPGMQIYLASPSLTAEQLAGIAEGLVVHGNGVSVGTLPAGVPELGERSRTAVIPDEEGDGGGQVMRRTDVEVVYRLGDPSGALRVQTADGDAAALADELGDEATPSADVRGHAAWAATLPPGSVHPSDSGTWNVERRRIFWQEAPGVVATVETWDTDYDLDVLRDVAEGLRAATDGEWAEMLVATDVAPGFLPQP
ncbi:MAG TPA: hypothetical protein VGO60_08170 [Iamia sp.]|nr:hypothetical protein [Iamia sp.]